MHGADGLMIEEKPDVETVSDFREQFWETNRHPSSILHGLPFLWSTVLFPGQAHAGGWSWRSFALVLLLPAVLLYPRMDYALFEPDEGRYAQIPREMLTRGDWVVPTLESEPYLDKPPLFYWLVMGSYSLFGFHIAAARIVPALATHLCVVVSYLLGRKFAGERAAFWGSLLLVLAPGFLGMGRLVLLDGLLTLWVSVALFSAFLAVREKRLHWGWWLVSAVAVGLGVLTKGPVAIILVVPPLIAWRWLTKQAHSCARIGLVAWLVFGGIVLAETLPWYVAVCLRMPEFARYFLWEHNVLRFLQPFDHERPVWFYVPIILGGLLPGMLLLPSWGRFLLSGRGSESRWRCAPMGFLLLAAGWCFLFFSLAGSKLPTYVLPGFPALALALGMYVTRMGWSTRRVTKYVLIGWSWVLGAGYLVVLPIVANERSPLRQMETIDGLCKDPNTPLYSFPRGLDSVAFYLGRADIVNYRTKDMGIMFQDMDRHPRNVVLFSHRHSLAGMEACLPPHMKVTSSAPLGLCDIAVVERK